MTSSLTTLTSLGLHNGGPDVGLTQLLARAASFDAKFPLDEVDHRLRYGCASRSLSASQRQQFKDDSDAANYVQLPPRYLVTSCVEQTGGKSPVTSSVEKMFPDADTLEDRETDVQQALQWITQEIVRI